MTFRPPIPQSTIDAAVKAAAFASHLTPDELLGRRRWQEVVQARYLAWFILRIKTRLSYPALARATGGWSHGNVLHGCRVTLDAMSIYHEMRQLYDVAVEKFREFEQSGHPVPCLSGCAQARAGDVIAPAFC